MKTWQDYWAFVRENCEPMIVEPEAHLLFEMGRRAEGGAIVEIGAWKGASTIMLAASMGANGVLFSIDPHTGSRDGMGAREDPTIEALRRNLAQVEFSGRVLISPSCSDESRLMYLALQPAVVFIDGAHTEEDVRLDLRYYGQLARRYLILDDFVYPGVTAAFERWRRTEISRDFAPADLTGFDISDPTHNRQAHGFVGKMHVLERIG